MAGEIEVKISQESIQQIVKARISAEVCRVLEGDSPRLIQAVVDAAFREKDPRGYGSSTIFENAVNAMIREEARKAVQAWIEAHRADVAKAVDVAIKRRRDMSSMLAEGLVKSLAEKIDVQIGVRERGY